MSRFARRLQQSVTGSSSSGGDVITHGSQLTSANTGPRIALTDFTATSGSQTISQSWLDTYNGGSNVIVGQRFQAMGFNLYSPLSTITSKTVIFRDCEFIGLGEGNGTAWFTYVSGDPMPADFTLQLEYCRFDGNGEVTGNAESAMRNGQFIATRCEVKDFCGMYRGSEDNITVSECYIHANANVPVDQNPNPHTSSLGFNSGSNILVERCKLFPGKADNGGISGALVCYGRQNSGLNNNVVVKDCALQGGSYPIYCGGFGDGTVTNCQFTGLIFYRDDWAKSGQYGTNTSFDTEGGNIFENNTWGPLGPQNVAGDPAEGVAVVPG